MPRKAPDSGIAKLFWRGNRQSILIEPLETGPAEGATATGGEGNR